MWVSDQMWQCHTNQLLVHSATVGDNTSELSREPDSPEMTPILPSRPDPIPVETQEMNSPILNNLELRQQSS